MTSHDSNPPASEPRATDSDGALGHGEILITGATGKTGRRVADLLAARGVAVRRGSRHPDRVHGGVRFDWEDRATWEPALRGAHAAYVTYVPDLAVPAAADDIAAFTAVAERLGVARLVVLSGRGEEGAERCERIVQGSRLAWTIVRADWFMQNFDEGEFLGLILGGMAEGGEVALPNGDVPEPFVDVDDIADVVVAALTESGHDGETYEVSGPVALTLREAVGEIAAAQGVEIAFRTVSVEEFTSGMAAAGVPAPMVELLGMLFSTILDGRNSVPQDGVERALGRPPRDFPSYARAAVARGAWAPIAKGA